MPTTTNYIWDVDNYLAESDATNTINVVYTNEPEQFGNLISSRISGSTSYHHFDALGSTRQLTNSAASVADTVIYDAWGGVVGRTGATRSAFLWNAQTGYYADVELVSDWVRLRPFCPPSARWASQDPARYLPIIPYFGTLVLDYYSYVGNRPMLRHDPSGLADERFCDSCREALFGGGGFAGAQLRRCLSIAKCPIVDTSCSCCSDASSTRGCAFIDYSGDIRINLCCGSVGLESVYAHELAHALRFCQVNKRPLSSRCSDCLREELLAIICGSSPGLAQGPCPNGTIEGCIDLAIASCKAAALTYMPPYSPVGPGGEFVPPPPPLPTPAHEHQLLPSASQPCSTGADEQAGSYQGCSAAEIGNLRKQAVMDLLVAYVKDNFGVAPDPVRSPLCRQLVNKDKCATFVPPNVRLE